MSTGTAANDAIWIKPDSSLSQIPGVADHPLLNQILLARGIDTPEKAEYFLNPRNHPLGNPNLLPDMERATCRIRSAIDEGETIVVFGDYDVDGVSSTAMLTRALRNNGATVVPVIPHRRDEGYGLSFKAIERVLPLNPDLVITVDCGSGNSVEIADLLSRDIDVIVLDHHQLHNELPAAAIFVSARRPENRYPETELAAVGVVFTMLRGLLGDDDAEMYLPYVALGTVADVVPLLGENRTLTVRGLDMLRRWQLPGITVLCRYAGLEKRLLSARDIGFGIGPRLNAAGRMDTPDIALELFLADDPESASIPAATLDRLNQARQAETRRIQDEAEAQISLLGGAETLPALVLSSPDWNIGVAGIVAGRLAESYHRPTIIIAEGDEMSVGSARSNDIVHMVDVMRPAGDLLDHFGGHSAAAGLTLPTDNIDRFREIVYSTVLDTLGGKLPRKSLRIDAVIPHEAISLDTVDDLALLEPYGASNEIPLLLFPRLSNAGVRTSRDGRHLLLRFADDFGRVHEGIFFGAGDRAPSLQNERTFDVAGQLVRDTFNGRTRAKIHLRDIRPSR